MTRARVRARDFALELSLRDGDTTTIYLENYFQESSHLASPEREVQVLGRIAAVLRPIEGATSWATAADRLLPVLRGQSFFRSGAGDRGTMPVPAAQPFVPHVDLGLVLDDADRMSYVSQAHLAEWGVTLDEALVHAMRNAARLPQPVPDPGAGVVFHVDADDSYESSRLAIPGLLASFADRVAGRPIAIIPTRSWLWITGDADPDLVIQLAAVADREYETSNRAISPVVYTVDGSGEVVPLHLPPEHRAYAAVRLGHVKLALREYAEQKADLDAQHERDGTDVHVATLHGIARTGDGLPLTWTVWTDGVDTLLPVADLVNLEPPPKARRGARRPAPRFVPFARLAEILGDGFVPAPGYRPPRVRVRRQPAGALRARLDAAALAIEDVPPP